LGNWPVVDEIVKRRYIGMSFRFLLVLSIGLEWALLEVKR